MLADERKEVANMSYCNLLLDVLLAVILVHGLISGWVRGFVRVVFRKLRWLTSLKVCYQKQSHPPPPSSGE